MNMNDDCRFGCLKANVDFYSVIIIEITVMALCFICASPLNLRHLRALDTVQEERRNFSLRSVEFAINCCFGLSRRH
jgi:hypothetical protein